MQCSQIPTFSLVITSLCCVTVNIGVDTLSILGCHAVYLNVQLTMHMPTSGKSSILLKHYNTAMKKLTSIKFNLKIFSCFTFGHLSSNIWVKFFQTLVFSSSSLLSLSSAFFLIVSHLLVIKRTSFGSKHGISLFDCRSFSLFNIFESYITKYNETTSKNIKEKEF